MSVKSSFQDLVQFDSKSFSFVIWKDEEVIFVCIDHISVMLSPTDFNDFVDGLKKFKKYNREDFHFDSEHFSFEISSETDEEFSHVHVTMNCGFITLDFVIPIDEFLDFLGTFSKAQVKLKELETK